MALTDKLTSIADAIRSKTGSTELLSLDMMAEEIIKMETDKSGTAAYELLYETTLSVDETLRNGTINNFALLDTDLENHEKPPYGDMLWAVIVCENDTETDLSYPHFKARAMIIKMDAQYPGVQSASGIYLNTSHAFYGYTNGLYVTGGDQYCSTIRITAKGSENNWGILPSGEYRFTLLRTNLEELGLGEI